MTIIGLELASFNSYRLHSTLPLFIMESRGDRLPSPASKVVLFSVSSSTEKISANIGETCVYDLIAENIHIFETVGRL